MKYWRFSRYKDTKSVQNLTKLGFVDKKESEKDQKQTKLKCDKKLVERNYKICKKRIALFRYKVVQNEQIKCEKNQSIEKIFFYDQNMKKTKKMYKTKTKLKINGNKVFKVRKIYQDCLQYIQKSYKCKQLESQFDLIDGKKFIPIYIVYKQQKKEFKVEEKISINDIVDIKVLPTDSENSLNKQFCIISNENFRIQIAMFVPGYCSQKAYNGYFKKKLANKNQSNVNSLENFIQKCLKNKCSKQNIKNLLKKHNELFERFEELEYCYGGQKIAQCDEKQKNIEQYLILTYYFILKFSIENFRIMRHNFDQKIFSNKKGKKQSCSQFQYTLCKIKQQNCEKNQIKCPKQIYPLMFIEFKSPEEFLDHQNFGKILEKLRNVCIQYGQRQKYGMITDFKSLCFIEFDFEKEILYKVKKDEDIYFFQMSKIFQIKDQENKIKKKQICQIVEIMKQMLIKSEN